MAQRHSTLFTYRPWISEMLIAATIIALSIAGTSVWQWFGVEPQPANEESSYSSYLLRSEERLQNVGDLQQRIFVLQREQFTDDVANNSTSWLAIYDGYQEWINNVDSVN